MKMDIIALIMRINLQFQLTLNEIPMSVVEIKLCFGLSEKRLIMQFYLLEWV